MHTGKTSIFYTAVGHFHRKADANGRTYPVILVNQEEHIYMMFSYYINHFILSVYRQRFP